MGKSKQAESKLQQKKTPKAPTKAPEVKTEQKATEKSNVVTEEEIITKVATKPELLLNRSKGSLSPDAKVQVLDLAHRVFVEETRPYLQFPQQTQIAVNRIVAVGILCTIADHVVDGDDQFAAVMQQQGYPSLVKAAEDLGFKLPDIKALPVKSDGTVEIPAKEVKISKEAKEQIKKEKETLAKEKPELDPEKITSEEDLKKALEYMFAGNHRLAEVLVEGINFMKKFRLHEASLAENADEAKAKFENYNSGDWLDDMFSYIRPSVFFSGIGRGMANVTAVEKNPIHAFTIFRDAIRNKETNEPVLEDQEIAYCVKSIVKWCCNTNIDSNQKAIDNLDPKKNKAEIEKCEAQIQNYNNILDYITSPSSEEVDNLLENIGSHFTADGGALTPECQSANATYNRICKTFYGKQLSNADYKNLDGNIQQYGYHIINLFRGPGEQLTDCGLSNISELEERTEEERKEVAAKAKKEWAERKAKEKEESTKNA